MFWPCLNATLGVIVACILVYKLVWRAHRFTWVERLGMGLLGASMILTLGPILSEHPTPFEDWSGTLLRVGCAVYFVGRLTRHRMNNAAMRRQAGERLGRG